LKSLKENAFHWLFSLCERYSLTDYQKSPKNVPFYFKIEGFGENPEIYIQATEAVLELGYEATQWDGYMPSPIPGIYKKHFVTWESLQSLRRSEEKLEKLLDLLMKTITSRKRQYRKCQFCGENVPVEHRFDKDTCHGCASEHFGVVY
jgi:hypothetical protein